jgi:hypothetical protein
MNWSINLSQSQQTNETPNTKVNQGVLPEDASYFLGRTYLSIVQGAERNSKDPNRFDELIEEQTPGGLNEQVSLFCFLAGQTCNYHLF